MLITTFYFDRLIYSKTSEKHIDRSKTRDESPTVIDSEKNRVVSDCRNFYAGNRRPYRILNNRAFAAKKTPKTYPKISGIFAKIRIQDEMTAKRETKPLLGVGGSKALRGFTQDPRMKKTQINRRLMYTPRQHERAEPSLWPVFFYTYKGCKRKSRRKQKEKKKSNQIQIAYIKRNARAYLFASTAVARVWTRRVRRGW